VSIPVPTALGHQDRLWPAVVLSAAVHAALVIWAIERRPPAIDLSQKPIVAKLVRLGEKRPEQYLPRKEAPPPAAPEPAAPAAPVAVATPAPAPAPSARPGPKAPAAPAPSAAPGSGASVASILSKVQRQVAEERWGDPTGDVAGTAEEAGEGDRYLALVVQALQANYRVPATISDRERLFLKGTVVLWIEPDGRIGRWHMEKPSGNVAFDDALDRTLRRTRLPPPPDALREAYRTTGLQVTFDLQN